MHHFIEGTGYWLWGIGTVLLLAVFVWAYVAYRRSGAAREQDEIERRSARWTRR